MYLFVGYSSGTQIDNIKYWHCYQFCLHWDRTCHISRVRNISAFCSYYRDNCMYAMPLGVDGNRPSDQEWIVIRLLWNSWSTAYSASISIRVGYLSSGLPETGRLVRATSHRLPVHINPSPLLHTSRCDRPSTHIGLEECAIFFNTTFNGDLTE